MSVVCVVGIDPGLSGGIAICRENNVVAYKMPETERDIMDLLDSWAFDEPTVFLEKVGPMPKQGVVSVWKFSANYNFLRGVITALRYPLYQVTPQTWQKDMSCRTGGDKNISKGAAQRLFPKIKVTHSIADALLIMEWGRRWMAKNQR